MLATLKRISIAFGLMAAFTVIPARAGTDNQQVADSVAASLRTSPVLQGYRIEIDSRDGLVTLRGTVSNPAEHAEAINLARRSQGVVAVIDRVKVSSDAAVQPAQYQVAMGGHGGGMLGHGAGVPGGYTGPITSSPMGGPMMGGEGFAGPVMDGGLVGGPQPEGAAIGGGTQASNPGAPNYAWPSYAPYPNFSAVGYPTAYPWQAWPNIGPFYPYPEVPLDWRAVTLRWDDGIWFLDFKKHYTRPFFTPYPFGILAY
jgi:hypothetical protein